MPYSYPMRNQHPSYMNQVSQYYQPQNSTSSQPPRFYNPRPSVNLMNIIYSLIVFLRKI